MSFISSGSNHRNYACLHLLYELDLKNDDGIIPLPCKSSLSSLISSRFQILVDLDSWERSWRHHLHPCLPQLFASCILMTLWYSKPIFAGITRSYWLVSMLLQARGVSKCSLSSLLHCWWEYKLVQPLWRTLWKFLLLLLSHFIRVRLCVTP